MKTRLIAAAVLVLALTLQCIPLWAQGYNNGGYNGGSGGSGGAGGITASSYSAPMYLANQGVTGTTQNKLAELAYTYGPFAATAITMASTTTGHTQAVGVVTSATANTGSATIVYQGPASLIFDGQTTVGDAFTYSGTVAANGHDAGVACSTSGSPPVLATQFIGCVSSANAGAGTAANVVMMLTLPHSIASSCKCIPGGNVTCAAASYTNICTCTVQLPFDAGSGNAEIWTFGGKLSLTFGATLPASIDFQMATSCPGANTDPHGLPLASYAINTTYPNETMPNFELTYAGGADPLASACTVQLQCKGQTNTFQVNAPANDGNGVPVGTGTLIHANPWTAQN